VNPGPSPSTPVLDLVGGPQGSGKSTFFPVAGRGFDSFNIDDHRKALNAGSSQNIPDPVRRQATADYQAFIERHIKSRTCFSIEVTLAKEITFRQAKRARRAGFRVQLTYVTAALETCIARVANRVDEGGHGVSADVIRETYAASLKKLIRALSEFDIVQVYNNSPQVGPENVGPSSKPSLVLEAQGGKIAFRTAHLPAWLGSALSGTPFASR
jgi:predicted ABC-type ATPase